MLFNGELDLYPHGQFHLKLKEGTVLVHKKPYPVLYKQRDGFCRELINLVKDRVLPLVGMTNWASPKFIIPKGDNRVQWVSNFQELNKVIERAQYPILRI